MTRVNDTGSSSSQNQPFDLSPSATTKLKGPPLRLAITGAPLAIASKKTRPNGSFSEGATNTSAMLKTSANSSWRSQPQKKTLVSPRRLAVLYGCSPSHSPGTPPQTRRLKGGVVYRFSQKKRFARAMELSSSGNRLNRKKRPANMRTGLNSSEPSRKVSR